jgi:hypothetical protein
MRELRCACDPAIDRVCGWHKGHPVTDSLEVLERDLANRKRDLARVTQRIEEAQALHRHKHVLEDFIRTLNVDIDLLKRSKTT